MSEKLTVKVVIDLQRIRRNLLDIREELNGEPVKLMLMLKADAYGHGIEQVAKATQGIVDGFGVVTLEEGLKVRQIAPTTPILVNMLLAGDLEEAVHNGLTIGLNNAAQLRQIVELSANNNAFKNSAKIHLKVDSGMHRLGFDIEDVQAVCHELIDAGLTLSGIYSHFGDHCTSQIAIFDEACKIVRGFFQRAVRHIASSHTYKHDIYRYDGVRIGLDAYLGAMRVESTVVAARRVQAGEYIGYGDYVLERPTNIAVIFGGYADGIDRERFKCVRYGDRSFRVVGVCMDLTLVDTEDILLTHGEKVCLIGEDSIADTAENMGTIPYTLMTAWKGRIDKIYV